MKPIMREIYNGIVDQVGKDHVTAIYEFGEDVFEQKYPLSHFIDGIIPKSGDKITTKILLCVEENNDS